MNILPHKSWHVRRKDNIERVRRDEAKAAEEEKERQRKIALAEQEARTELLRSRNKKRLTESDVTGSITTESQQEETNTETSVDIYQGTGGHINFFKDAEDGIADKKKNVEHEKEKKEERETWEKKMGILTYLGQSAQDPTPWYMSKKRKREDDDEDSAKKDRDKKRKHNMDPIHDLKKYVEKTRDVHNPGKQKNKHKHKEKKKHKHKSKDREKTSSSKLSKSSSKTMEELRAERLKREAEERKRTADLMARLKGETPSEKKETVELSDRRRGYNSQYNPDFVRQPRFRP